MGVSLFEETSIWPTTRFETWERALLVGGSFGANIHNGGDFPSGVSFQEQITLEIVRSPSARLQQPTMQVGDNHQLVQTFGRSR